MVFHYFNIKLSVFQGFTELWSIGNLKIKHLNLQRDIVDRQFLHSRKWKKQHALSVMRIFLEKGVLVGSTGALCVQERYSCSVPAMKSFRLPSAIAV